MKNIIQKIKDYLSGECFHNWKYVTLEDPYICKKRTCSKCNVVEISLSSLLADEYWIDYAAFEKAGKDLEDKEKMHNFLYRNS